MSYTYETLDLIFVAAAVSSLVVYLALRGELFKGGNMAIVTYKTAGGRVETWTCQEEKLEHVLEICEAKGLEVIDFEVLR